MTGTILIADATVGPGDAMTMALRAVGIHVAALCSNAAEVVPAALQARPDLAIVAKDLPGGGMTAIVELGRALPDLGLVLRAAHLDDEDLVAALRAGVRGMVHTDLDLQALCASILGALRGEATLPRGATSRVVDAYRRREAAKRAALSPRQWQILELLAAGRSTAEIAESLEVREVTVRSQVTALRRKLGLDPRKHAAAAMRATLEGPDPP